MYIHVPRDEKCPPWKLKKCLLPLLKKKLLMKFVEKKMQLMLMTKNKWQKGQTLMEHLSPTGDLNIALHFVLLGIYPEEEAPWSW